MTTHTSPNCLESIIYETGNCLDRLLQTSIAIHCVTRSVFFSAVGKERSSTVLVIWRFCSAPLLRRWCGCRSRGIARSRTGGSGNVHESIRSWGVAGAVSGSGPCSSISGVAGALDVSLCAFNDAVEEGLHLLHLFSKSKSIIISP